MPIIQFLLKLAASPSIIFSVALVARLLVLSQLLPANAWRYFYQYNEPSHIAWSLVSGSGYSSPWANTIAMGTAQQPPVYPYLLAVIFKVAGIYTYSSLWTAVALNAVFSAITAVLILDIGKRMFGTSTGILAAWIWSCWIYEAVVSIRLWESSLSALLLSVALWLLPKLAESRRPLLWISFGILGGVASLTNTTLLSVFPFFWLWLWMGCRHRNLSCGRWLAASIAACLLVTVPWTIRNYNTFHRVVPLRDNFGLELWIGNHEGVNHEFPSDFPLLNPAEYNRLGEIEFMESRREIAAQFISQHPVEFLRLSLRRIVLFWTDPRNSVWPWISLLAWVGTALALRCKSWTLLPCVIVMLMFPLVYYVTHTSATYRHPMESTILLFAAYACVRLAESAITRLKRSSSQSSALGVPLFLNGCTPDSYTSVLAIPELRR